MSMLLDIRIYLCSALLICMFFAISGKAQIAGVGADLAKITSFDRMQPRGVLAVSLGAAVTAPPKLTAELADWKSAVTLTCAYRVYGLAAPVLPAEARLLWDDTALYVMFRCADSGLAAYANSRQDAVDLLLSRDFTTSPNYLRFTLPMQGKATGQRFTPEEQQTTAPLEGFTTEVLRRDGEWLTQVTVPWTLLGGKPRAPFGMEIVRSSDHNGEQSTPAAIDHIWASYPALFMETTLGGTSAVITDPATLATTPSGRRHWQATTVYTRPGRDELQTLWAMQQRLSEPTTPETLAPRIYLAQRWHDLLELEGLTMIAELNPVWVLNKDEFVPETARAAVNRALAANDTPGACAVVDRILKVYDKISRTWFADESPGNIRADGWSALDRIDTVSQQGTEVLIQGHAGQTAITFHVTCPASGGMRLRTDPAGFFNPEALAEIRVTKAATGAVSVSGLDSTLVIRPLANWSMTLIDGNSGQERWRLQQGDLRFRFNKDGVVQAVDVQWPLATDEGIYGFGEYWNSLNQRGNTLTLYAQNCADAISNDKFGNSAYKPIPLMHSTNGYSLFFDTSYRLRADVGCNDPQRCRITSQGPLFDLYLWAADPLKNLQSYSALTGKPLLPPRWVFEPWAGGGTARWEIGGMRNTAQEVINVLDRFKALDIPHSAVYAEGSPFSDPRLSATLTPRGIHVLGWGRSQAWGRGGQTLPGVPENETPVLRWVNGQVIRYANGVYPVTNNALASEFPYIDFTNPHAVALLRASWKRNLDNGMAGMMLDGGDEVPDDAKFANGHLGDEMHNRYAYDYHRIFNQVFTERRGDDFVLFARSAAPGSQHFTCFFAGDQESTFFGILSALRGGINLAASGCPFWGCDIGGYGGRPDEEVYLRWVGWSAFSPIMRVHTVFAPREPWFYSDDAVRIYKKFTWTRENLLDYLYSSAVSCHQSGAPMMCPLPMAFPDQPRLVDCADEYLFGSELLVAPIHASGLSRPVTFPAGRWTNLWNGKTITGGVTNVVETPMDEMPVYLREGAIVPVWLNPSLKLGDSLSSGKVAAFLLTPPKTTSSARCWQTATESATLTTTHTDTGLRIERNGRSETFFLLLYGLPAVVARVQVDGTEFPLLTGNQLTSLPPGWYQDGALRTVIRLPYAVKQTVEITFAAGQ